MSNSIMIYRLDHMNDVLAMVSDKDAAIRILIDDLMQVGGPEHIAAAILAGIL